GALQSASLWQGPSMLKQTPLSGSPRIGWQNCSGLAHGLSMVPGLAVGSHSTPRARRQPPGGTKQGPPAQEPFPAQALAVLVQIPAVTAPSVCAAPVNEPLFTV